MKYDWVLFDADETLFSFDAQAGLRIMLQSFGHEASESDFAEYQLTNRPLWLDYQEGRITALEVQQRRFAPWAERLQVCPSILNSAFLAAMAEICRPLEGVIDLLRSLRGRVRLGIITNGFGELQQVRLRRCGLEDYFELVVVSEQVGFAKPHPEIFRHALRQMGGPSPERVLMVGDNLDTDIRGGLEAGLDTCWVNWHGRDAHYEPTFQVRSPRHLSQILGF
ncbi:pyrimidine 5'-nucleotidase [bacterium]|nr:pyrimidine 5'-nucleotidase [bacterium]